MRQIIIFADFLNAALKMDVFARVIFAAFINNELKLEIFAQVHALSLKLVIFDLEPVGSWHFLMIEDTRIYTS